ncbi:flavo protein [Cutaneotrichosporon oleaginosum]|uniref:Flavo protein n=1 Tax=Cutaneotrichosporon oleaginosum TaxID=879819 RepID=A0A0J0XRK2_9TREE|nr:flavo protein [Cutaneotrichosporon oleaginosum]KLT43761.1 flavo protein [Cutaneotrichosporon oleaginosum]TXT05178.1 hypothetical protein COLE_06498 [Cutaneotrichosporon oleaginosum]
MQRSVAVAVAAGAILTFVYHVVRARPVKEKQNKGDEEDEEGETFKLGLVLGSERKGGNTVGMGVYLSALLPTLPFPARLVLDVVDLAELDLPRTFSHVPAKGPQLTWQYVPSADALWSARVRSWDAVLFVAPEYNGHVPGILKSALDRLYGEWQRKPAGLVALGSEGGRRLLQRGAELFAELGMEVVGGVGVTTSGRRVTGDEEWLGAVRNDIESVVLGLVAARRT